jgi:hypothetical protein
MTVPARSTPALDAATARLKAAQTDPWAIHYCTHQALRCADDALRLAALHPGARELNVGGAPYLFEVCAAELGLSVDTLDIAPARHAAVIAEFGLNVRALDFENAAARGALDLAAYDVICLCEVFEHMRIDLIGMLTDIRARMAPHAVVYLTTPNFYYAPRFLPMLWRGRSGPSLVSEWRKLGELGHMGHVREYARVELEELFRFVGFTSDFAFRNSRPTKKPVGRFLARFDRFCQEFVVVLKP